MSFLDRHRGIATKAGATAGTLSCRTHHQSTRCRHPPPRVLAMTDLFTPSLLTSSSPPISSTAEYVSAGDVISHNPTGNLLGHGTLLVNNKIIATVSGHIERVNKLISVRPLSSRYTGDIGDIVIGRIVELGDQRWKVDIGARQHATLLLASIHLPGGALRRRTAEDQLAMRQYFAPADILACEVQKVRGEGGINLHTRSERYGRRRGGLLVVATSTLIKRCKQHFQPIEGVEGIELVLGCNGWVWLGKRLDDGKGREEKMDESEAEREEEEERRLLEAQTRDVDVSVEERERIVRAANSVYVLSCMGVLIWNVTIAAVYATSVELGLPAKAMRNPDVMQVLVHSARAKQNEHSGGADFEEG